MFFLFFLIRDDFGKRKNLNKEIYTSYTISPYKQGYGVNEEDKKTFLDDFKKADVQKKLDMWYFAVEQEGIWEEILAEMSMVAQAASPQKGKLVEEE